MRNTLVLFFTLTAFFAFNQNVNIPDANFKTYLVGNFAINTNLDTEIQISEANAYSASLNLDNLNIIDLTGIEHFTAIPSINIDENKLTEVNLSSNISLERVKGSNNDSLVSLNLSNLPNLTYIEFRNGSINNLDFSNSLMIDTINFRWNKIDSIDVSFLSNLKYLYLDYNELTFLNINNNTNLQHLRCSYNNLDSIDVSALTNLTVFTVGDNNLSTIDVSNNIQLVQLGLFQNNLSALDLSNNTLLENLVLHYNNLTQIDLSNNLNLIKLYLSNNNFTIIDISAQHFITLAYLQDNPLLQILNVANGNNVNFTHHNFENLPSLNCIEVDDVAYANVNFYNKDSTTSYSLDCNYCLTSQSVIDTTICDGEIYISPNFSDYTSSGTYFDTLQNSCNSDSVIVTNLTVLKNEITNNNGILEATTGFDAYQWFKDANAISNETNANFTPIESGDYSCEATKNTCSSTSNIIKIDLGTSINNLAFENLNVYPNPTSGIINIDTKEALIPKAIGTIRILDLAGKEIKTFAAETKALNISEFSTGIYFLEIANAEKKSVIKILKR